MSELFSESGAEAARLALSDLRGATDTKFAEVNGRQDLIEARMDTIESTQERSLNLIERIDGKLDAQSGALADERSFRKTMLAFIGAAQVVVMPVVIGLILMAFQKFWK